MYIRACTCNVCVHICVQFPNLTRAGMRCLHGRVCCMYVCMYVCMLSHMVELTGFMWGLTPGAVPFICMHVYMHTHTHTWISFVTHSARTPNHFPCTHIDTRMYASTCKYTNTHTLFSFTYNSCDGEATYPYICICIHICVCIYTCVCIFIVRISLTGKPCIRLHAMYIHTYAYTHGPLQGRDISAYTLYTYIHIYTRSLSVAETLPVRTCIHTYHIYAYTCIHTHACTRCVVCIAEESHIRASARRLGQAVSL